MLHPSKPQHRKPTMKNACLLLICSALLPACKTAPTAPPPLVVHCPKVPPLEWPAPVLAFMPQMQNFLSGSLPKPTRYELTSGPARLPTMRP